MFRLLCLPAVLLGSGQALSLSLRGSATLAAGDLQQSGELAQVAAEISSAIAKLSQAAKTGNTPAAPIASLAAAGKLQANSTAAGPVANASSSLVKDAASRASARKLQENATIAGPVAKASSSLGKEQEVLQNLFSHLKSRIAKYNADEVANKDSDEKAVARLQQRLDREHSQLNSSNVSGFERQLLVNRTRMDEKELAYFEHNREIQHGMFHANLRVTHSLMSHVKTVMDVYQGYLAGGKLTPELADKMKAVSAMLPKALLQLQSQTRRAA